MTEHIFSEHYPSAPEADVRSDPDTRQPAAPSGKPYEWRLPVPEDPALVALSPEALAERAFVRRAEFQTVLQRVAAYFIVVSRTNLYEGRDPLIIADDVRCGAVADLLGIELDLLSRVLLEMARRGMVSFTDDGNLRVEDLQGLDDLSEGR